MDSIANQTEKRKPPISDERTADLERHASILVLSELVDRYGVEAVTRWLRNLAAIHGVTL